MPHMADAHRRIHFVPLPDLDFGGKVFSPHPRALVDSGAVSKGKVGVMAMAVTEEKEEVWHLPKIKTTTVPSFHRLRSHLSWWEANGASQDVLKWIRQGVTVDYPLPSSLSLRQQNATPEQIDLAQQVLQEYKEAGAVRPVTWAGTRHLITWFVLKKTEGQGVKLRLIANCRELNRFLNPQPFRMDHWVHIFPTLRKGMRSAKIDLKNAFFHLGLHPDIKNFARLQVGEQFWEFQAACFGMSTLPQIWTKVMKVLQKHCRNQGI